MLKVENLVKKYGSATALDGISFSVEAGEVVGFLGPNGAGKSTTMNIITGFISSNVGKVWIDGVEILENPNEAKKKIGYLPEQPPLYPEMTVEEYLNFVYELRACTLPRKAHLGVGLDLNGKWRRKVEQTGLPPREQRSGVHRRPERGKLSKGVLELYKARAMDRIGAYRAEFASAQGVDVIEELLGERVGRGAHREREKRLV